METQIRILLLMYLFVQGEQQITIENVETTSLATLINKDNSNTTDALMSTSTDVPVTEPPVDCTDTSTWSDLPTDTCARYLFQVCKRPGSDFMCVCHNKCPEQSNRTGTTEDPNKGFDCTNMEGWGDNGLNACFDIIFGVCNLEMERTEYMCVCNGACNKTVAELDDLHADKTAREEREKNLEHYIVKGVVYFLIFIVGLCGNVLVIMTVTKFMGKTTVTNIYICNLAVADLMVILICIPTKAVETIDKQWRLGETVCKLTAWFYFASFMWSAFTLMCMSLERYMVINHPMKAHGMSSTKRTFIIIAGIWILGIALSLPTYFVALELRGNYCVVSGYDFDQKRAFYIYIFVAIFLVPSLLMGFAYIRTSITLWKSVQKQNQMKQSSDGKDDKASDSSGRVQVIRILISVLVVFVVCWAPYLSMQIYVTTHHYRTNLAIRPKADDIVQWFNFLSLANSALNPILYGFLSRQFRMGFLRCLTCNKKGKEPSKSYITTSGGVSMTSRVTTATTVIKPKSAADVPHTNGVAPNPAVNESNGVTPNPAVNESDNKL